MWICARCGTEAKRPEICSGCGGRMRPFDEPPLVDRYQFVLIDKRNFGAYGTFPNVMAADTWASTHLDHHDYEVALMESPPA